MEVPSLTFAMYIIALQLAIISMTNPTASASIPARQAGKKKPAYLAGFFLVAGRLARFLGVSLCGVGGVFSIRRSTSSGFGNGWSSWGLSGFMAGV